MNKSAINQLIIGAFFMVTAIILGAFGAHKLKEILDQETLKSFQTGVIYQITQGISIILMALVGLLVKINLRLPIRLLAIGIICFSFSIYALSLIKVGNAESGLLKILGPITPIGGLLMIAAWLIFIVKLINLRKNL